MTVSAGEYQVAVATAAPDVEFRFAGPPPVGVHLRGRDAFADWFRDVFELFPGLRIALTDVVVTGWPWRTTAVVKLRLTARLADGSTYENQAMQWLRLRWGRMVYDEVIEDTHALVAARAVRLAAR
ncbi:nuclear transport factor 2 family protein [Dactylosporangium aurantiacum]|uniref:Nuclear transport factor 2 family protein n=1 Tax=Dactylosporangium aurantiacum TaxID=35754 RepID=A0A9Q9MA73_9ACTN|nr:nuclear transport factor 2 family protein [Dactylosporangium aurantiacum]MDG6104998.1 nuclear transport factor 2 family protein [Dactylosporangium aurantiacum]UWZ51533.1 nuclear transport factor 2 family protein [Dactylosporangium aurantiacum]